MLGPNGDTVIERNIGTQFSEILGNQSLADEIPASSDSSIMADSPKDTDQTDRNAPA